MKKIAVFDSGVGAISVIREIDKTLLFVTPGIRLNTTTDDHAKVFTPREAIQLGSNYIVTVSYTHLRAHET